MLSVVSVRLLHLWLACVTPLLCLLQEGFHAEDDANANDDYDREDRDEEERRIQDMLDRAAADARAARERAVAGEKGINAAIRGVACEHTVSVLRCCWAANGFRLRTCAMQKLASLERTRVRTVVRLRLQEQLQQQGRQLHCSLRMTRLVSCLMARMMTRKRCLTTMMTWTQKSWKRWKRK